MLWFVVANRLKVKTLSSYTVLELHGEALSTFF